MVLDISIGTSVAKHVARRQCCWVIDGASQAERASVWCLGHFGTSRIRLGNVLGEAPKSDRKQRSIDTYLNLFWGWDGIAFFFSIRTGSASTSCKF